MAPGNRLSVEAKVAGVFTGVHIQIEAGYQDLGDQRGFA
jgi:hypothetical protein